MHIRGNVVGVKNEQFISIRNYMAFPFKVPPIESNVFSHPFLPRFYVLPEGFFLADPQLRRYGPLDGPQVLKTDPLDDPFKVGKNKKVTRNKIR